MKTRYLLAASLALATPLVYAQDAQPTPPPSSQNTPPPASTIHRDPNHDWGQRPPRDGGDRGGRDHDGGPERGFDRGERGDGLPFGMWWKNPEVAARIGLTPDQQKRIEDVFLQSRIQLIHMHASLEEEQLLLEPLLSANPLDQAKAQAQIDKIADTRADLEKANARMLLNIRGVLTADQWAKLRGHDHGMPRPAGEWRDKHADGPPKAN
jgi:Spy/CpxP family protein refolding chaperone